MGKSLFIRKAAVIFMVAGCFSQLQAVCDADWTGLGANNLWTDSANWKGCIPGLAGDSATFNSLSPNNSPTLTSSETLTNLIFDSAAISYTISGTGPLNFSGTDASVQVLAGSHTINSTLKLDPSNNLLIQLDGNLTYTGGVFFAGNGTTITMDGTGTFSPGIGTFFPYNFVLNGGTLNEFGITQFFVNNTFIMNGGNYLGTYAGFAAISEVAINGGSAIVNEGVINWIDSFYLNGGSIVVNKGVVDGAGPLFSTGGSLVINNGLLVTSGTIFLSGGSIQLSPATINSPLIQMSGGLLTLDSNSTFSAATLNMSGGELIHNGNSSGLNNIELTGGLFRGLGTLAPSSEFTNSGGVVEPGDAPGALTLTSGTYIQTSGGTLQIDFLSPAVYGTLVAPTATIDGTLLLEILPGFKNTSGKVFQVLTTNPSGLSGEFSKITKLNFPSSLVPFVSYSDDAVLVSFDDALPKFFSVKEVVISNINQINYLLFNRLGRLTHPCRCDSGFDAYLDPIGSVGNVRSKKATKGYNFYTAGVLLGGDYATNCFAVGAEVDYQRLHGSVYDRLGSFNLDQLHGSVYGSGRILNHLYIDGVIGGGYQWNSLNRRTGFSDELHAKSSPNASIFDALGGLEYRGYLGSFNSTPFFTAQYIQYHINSAHETSADNFNLTFDRQKYESVRTTLGLRLDGTYCIGGIRINPSINAAWQREYSERRHLLSYLNQGTGFIPSEIEIPECSRNVALAGVNIEVLFTESLSAEMGYEFEGNNRLINNFFYLGLNAAF